MNTRAVVPQVALALLGLVAAFLVWRREPEGLPGEVPVLDVSPRALVSVRYEDASRSVELYGDARDEDTVWVRLGEPAPETTEEARPPPPPPRELRGNALAKSLLSSFAPLEALRGLGALDAKKLAELGISGSPRRLTVTVEGREHVLTLAAPVETDWGSPYVLREDGRVFLLGPTLLPDLEAAAARLVDRRMHAFGPEDFDTFTVAQGGNTRAIAVGEPPRAPDARERQWHERVWQLMPLDVLGRDEAPPGGEPEVLFQVGYQRRGRALGHVAVARDPEGAFYARTEHTAGWVRLQGEVEALAAGAVEVASARGSL
jgi:hypothetical protein